MGRRQLLAITGVFPRAQTTLRKTLEILLGVARLEVRDRSSHDVRPERFADVLAAVFAFADPVPSGTLTAAEWNPESEVWQ